MQHPPLVLLASSLLTAPVLAQGACFGSSFHFGTSTPGTGGAAPTIELAGCPGIGQSIAIEVDEGLAFAPTCVFFGAASRVPTDLSLGLDFEPILVLTPATDIGILLDGAGAASIALTVPFDLALVDTEVSVQAVSLDPGAAVGISASDGLTLRFGGVPVSGERP